MSKGASLAPQEIKMLFAVLPETTCQGLFSTVHRIFKKSTRQKPGAQRLPACSSKQIYAYQHKSSKGLKNLLLLLPKM